jgi:hypothetical protein
MILQAFPDVDLTLLDTLFYKIDFLLERPHGRNKLSKNSFNVEEGGTTCDDDVVVEVSTGTGGG